MKKDYKHIVILTGAGISAESGIKTFRDSNGLWEDHAIEDVASPIGFKRDPDLVYRFYNARRAQVLDHEQVSPNLGHIALAKLERESKAKLTLITQNVDDLHERAGSKEVLHMHGSLMSMRCQSCQKVMKAQATFNRLSPCPKCTKAGQLRPDIVWFGEMPFHLDRAASDLSQCDLFLCIGTSGLVYPAAQFVNLTNSQCSRIEFNLQKTQISGVFDKTIIGPSGETLPQFVESLLK